MQTIEQRIDAVRNDREHGSRWLVRETILILRDLAQTSGSSQDQIMHALYQTGQTLVQARPAMAALSSAVGRILNVQGGPTAVAQRANSLLQEYDNATARIANFARPLLRDTLLTCSISGTVLDVLKSCRDNLQRVIVMEGRPRYEGRETARELSQLLPVTLITDAQADVFLPECQAVVVGADSVLANGDVLNKAGTALLGWAARGHNVPFYALCETLKISPHSWKGDLSLLEEKEPQEVWDQPPAGVTVRNFYFDRTPHHLITGVIAEQGILDQHGIEKIAAQARADLDAFLRSQ